MHVCPNGADKLTTIKILTTFPNADAYYDKFGIK